VGAEFFHSDGKTDGQPATQKDILDTTKQIVTFHNLANARKSDICRTAAAAEAAEAAEELLVQTHLTVPTYVPAN
jgi:hypothetical protein